jgi:hypothetical protein
MTRRNLALVSNAQTSPVCEATVSGPASSSTAESLPRWKRTFQSVARLFTVARQTATALLDLVALSQIRIAKEIIATVPRVMEALFGDDFEYTEGEWCAICDDVHEIGTNCPRALIGLCVDCHTWKPLDRFGNCNAGHTSVTKRRPMYPSTYLRELNSYYETPKRS